MDRASEIHVFGHSMGETDYPYFKNFFNVASDGQFLYTNKNFYMHYYGSKSHEDLMNHIDKMTNGTIRSLKQKIKFFPIDIK